MEVLRPGATLCGGRVENFVRENEWKMSYEVETIGNCTLYRGDCRDVFESIDKVDALITDPVCPNNNVKEFQKIDPRGNQKSSTTTIDVSEQSETP